MVSIDGALPWPDFVDVVVVRDFSDQPRPAARPYFGQSGRVGLLQSEVGAGRAVGHALPVVGDLRRIEPAETGIHRPAAVGEPRGARADLDLFVVLDRIQRPRVPDRVAREEPPIPGAEGESAALVDAAEFRIEAIGRAGEVLLQAEQEGLRSGGLVGREIGRLFPLFGRDLVGAAVLRRDRRR